MNSTIQLIHLTVRFEREEQARRNAFVPRHDDWTDVPVANQRELDHCTDHVATPCLCRQGYGMA